MRWIVALVFAIAVAALAAAPARAQTITDLETAAPGGFAGGGGALPTVTINATLTQAIQLTITGIPDGAATTSISGAGNAGVVDFGVITTDCSFPLANGQCVRSTSGQPGAFLVASFRARVSFSGLTSADLGISRNGPIGGSPPDFGMQRLRFALGLATPWTQSTQGTNMPNTLAAAAENNLGAGLASGTAVDHQVALRFPDNAQQGVYSTTVRWTATSN
jgi:hypothetical protein